MIKEEFIQLNIEVNDWEDAIRKSATPLLTGGKITNEYIDKIVEISKSIGPYIVITKHVALPHAPVENGALAPAMGIMTLKNPVISGNHTNDPVKYLFCMSASDSESHLQSMSELVELLSDDEFYNVLDSSKTSKEVLEYVKKSENK